MASDETTLHAADRRLEEARREVELRLGELREAVEEELGFLPRRRYWLVAAIAGAAGLALALRRTRKRRRSIGARRESFRASELPQNGD